MDVSKAARELGRKGGLARSKKYGIEYMRDLARRAGIASGEAKRAKKSAGSDLLQSAS